MPFLKKLSALLMLAALGLLSGCGMVVMKPSGDVAMQQRDLILISTGLMLIIIIPVICLTLFFAYKYRASNKEASYEPDWDHSTGLELIIWSAPLLIIIALGAITWISTHTLDPYRPLDRIAENRAVPTGTQPLEVEVVALDWKWLFIYPEQGIATVNELAAPVDRPITFRISASSVMNSFFVPALAGQIYAMPGMETKLHAVINQPGVFDGFSANYSGAGFSHMRFKFHGLSNADFDKWVQTAKDGGGTLDRPGYLELERPSEREPVRKWATVAPKLFDAVVNRCVEANRMCMKDMMAIDAKGGLDVPGRSNLIASAALPPVAPGVAGRPARTYVASMCTAADPAGTASASQPL